MSRHSTFKHRSASPARRRSSCLNFMHEPKAAFATRALAEAERDRMEPRADTLPEPYECDEHGWHLGTPRVFPEYRRPLKTDGYALRNVHRVEYLVDEVGERAAALMLSESHAKQTVRLGRVVQRISAAVRRAARSASSSAADP